jgi:hypothetical protein
LQPTSLSRILFPPSLLTINTPRFIVFDVCISLEFEFALVKVTTLFEEWDTELVS